MNIVLIFENMDEVEKYFHPEFITRIWSDPALDLSKKLCETGLTFQQRRELIMAGIKDDDFDTCRHLIEEAKNWGDKKTKTLTPEEWKQWNKLYEITYHVSPTGY